jgi:16S rRNA (guanine527-N7)-methyltransferase
MTEEEAKLALNVPRETMDRLSDFVTLLLTENDHQNLISRSSVETVWARHILDSAQLVRFAPPASETWLDIGSGPGLPGLITAVLFSGVTTLVEPRKLRVEFLERAAEVLGVSDRVLIRGTKIEAVNPAQFDVISARAFAPLAKLLDTAERFAASETRWILPKGKNARRELEAAESLWQGEFRVEPSRTDPEAGIIIADRVRRRPRGRRGR